ncbi:MAG: SLATT domain-containing protein [Chloroflexi bacterium]|nr:MAG: SLATT domain-containing protein [Chloroflexota bacterium]
MNQRDDQQFLELYRKFRYEDQLVYYLNRRGEFSKAQAQAFYIIMGLLAIVVVAGTIASFDVPPWLKWTCLLAAAICPVLSTAFTAYSALYGFEQQAKLYQDTIRNLQQARVLMPDVQRGLSQTDFANQLDNYVQEIESTFLKEQSQWGQFAKNMKPPEP